MLVIVQIFYCLVSSFVIFTLGSFDLKVAEIKIVDVSCSSVECSGCEITLTFQDLVCALCYLITLSFEIEFVRIHD